MTGPSSPGRRLVRGTGLLRLGSLFLLALALLDLPLLLPSRSRSLGLLIDCSAALDEASLARARELALSLAAGMGPRDRLRVFAFSEELRLLGGPWTRKEALEGLRALRLPAPAGRARLGLALAGAAPLLRSEGLASSLLVLLSPLRDLEGRSPREAALEAGLPLLVLPLGPAPSPLRSLGLRAPVRARPGESLSLGWRLEADAPTELRWELLRDGVPVATGRASLGSGTRTIEARAAAGPPGLETYEFRALDPAGREIPGLGAGTALEVEGGSSVLVLSQTGSSPLLAALRTQGIEARGGGAAELPSRPEAYAGLSAVLLDDLPALAFSASQLSALSAFVAGGGGLLAVGGPSSFGRGEYFASPLEDILPVRSDTRQRLFHTRTRLLFVLDHSGSMALKVGGESKQEAAMRGVAAAIKELEPYDEVGVLSFDSEPGWVLPFTPVSKLASVEKLVASIPEGGGTDLGSALEAALAGFGPPGPTRRHIVVLSDGFTSQADWASIVAGLRGAEISLSTIAVGQEVNEELLRALATETGGAYWRAEGSRIPAVMDEEALRLSRELLREGSFLPLAEARDPALEGLGELPPITGYLLASPKPLSTVLLSLPQPGGGRDPLLVRGPWGAGQAAAFLSDSGARWLRSWAGRPLYNRLWAQLLREIEAPRPAGDYRSRAELQGGEVRISVEARSPAGKVRSGLRLLAEDPVSGAALVLREEAPGSYTGSLPLSGRGLRSYRLSEGGRPAGSFGLWVPPAGSDLGLGPDLPAAADLARATGGSLLSATEPRLPPPALGLRRLPGRPLLVGLGLLLLLLELFLRSALSGQVGEALRALGSWLRATSREAEEGLRKAYMGVVPRGGRRPDGS